MVSKLNTQKTRLTGKNIRQEVTGITVNKFPNVRRKFVRQIRAMLHAWERFGLEAAQEEFRKNYDKKHRSPWTSNPLFKRVLKGKIEFLGMVRGKTDPIYVGLCTQLRALAPDLVKLPKGKSKKSKTQKLVKLHVVTEGKTDWKHLKYARHRLLAQGYNFTFDIEFDEYETVMGDKELLKLCKLDAKVTNAIPKIFIFDRDNLSGIREAIDDSVGYKDWGNNVYSLAIPVPTHRRETPNISIEFYYKDDELRRQDKAGRRLFLSDEFSDWGRHKTLPITCNELNKIKSSNVSIIDCKVYGDDGNDLALPKNDFAENIINQEAGFNDFNFVEFKNIFDIVSRIAKRIKP